MEGNKQQSQEVIQPPENQPFELLLTCHQEQQQSRLGHDAAATANYGRKDSRKKSQSHCFHIARGVLRVSTPRPDVWWVLASVDEAAAGEAFSVVCWICPDDLRGTFDRCLLLYPILICLRVTSITFSECLDGTNRPNRMFLEVHTFWKQLVWI